MSREVVDAADFEGDTELSLGLSLGGCFAVEPRETRLLRSSSAVMISALPNEVVFTLSSAPLARSCSLPVVAEEEQLKRMEMEGLKGVEAKRKRSEKSSARPEGDVRSGDRKEEGWVDETNGGVLLGWGMGAGGGGVEVDMNQLEAMRRRSSDFDGRELQGSKASILSSSSTVPSLPKTDQKSVAVPPLPLLLKSLKSFQDDDAVLQKITPNSNGSKDIGRNIMAEMPCVFTKGRGPNGKRIEGFLYNYTVGEVRIVCVCHGNFHTPAEFINHAGGGVVENPLRHIVVTATSSLL